MTNGEGWKLSPSVEHLTWSAKPKMRRSGVTEEKKPRKQIK